MYAWYSVSPGCCGGRRDKGIACTQSWLGPEQSVKLCRPLKVCQSLPIQLLLAYCQLSSQVSATRSPPPGSLPCSPPCIHLLVCTFLNRNCKHPCSLSASSQVVFRGRDLVLVTLPQPQHQLVTVMNNLDHPLKQP